MSSSALSNLKINIFFTMILFFLGLSLYDKFPNLIFEDDAYFYFQIAKNAILNNNISFDSLDNTNGFHLFWAFILIFIGKLFNFFFHPNNFFLTLLFLSIGSTVVFLIFRQIHNHYIPFSFSLVILSGFCMESILASLLIIFLLDNFFNEKKIHISFILSYLIVLTRIDLSIIIFSFSLIFIFNKDFKLALILIIAVFFSVLTTFSINYFVDTQLISVSSYIKASSIDILNFGSIYNQFIFNFSSSGNLLRLFSLMLLVFLIFINIVILNKFDHLKYNKKHIIGFVLSILSFIALHIFFSDLRDWYFATSFFPLIFLLCKVLNNNFFSLYNKLIVYFFSIINIASFTLYFFVKYPDIIYTSEFLQNVKKIVPKNEVIYVYDGSGYLAWMLEDNIVINGDGLVNSHEYAKNKYDENFLIDYFVKKNINYYINNYNNLNCPSPYLCLNDRDYKLLTESKSNEKYTNFKLMQLN